MTAPLSSSDRPAVRLKPKADARKLRHGVPWAFDVDLVTDRRTRALTPGSLAVLQDAGRQDIGLAAINPKSKIMARVLDTNPDAQINTEWFATRLQRALDLREMQFDQPYYRLVHAEADGLPAVIIDRFGDTAVLQPNGAWAELHLDALTEALVAVTGCKTVLKNAAGRARTLEGLDDLSTTLVGTAPDGPLPVPMNGATYMADVTGGQKTGLFFDQRPNHAFIAGLAKGKTVLDLFSHVGGFSLAALANGATSAVAVDGSAPALALAEAGAKASGVADKFSTRRSDAFDALAAFAQDGAQFDIVICDPPAFAPSKKALETGLRAYEKLARQAAPLVKPGGILGLCSCSHAASLDKFLNANTRGLGRAGRPARLIRTGFAGPDHPQLPQLGETGYLKTLFFAL